MIEVVLEGPGKNALGTGVMQAALDAVRAANGAPLLLTGRGDVFSAGLNLKEVATLDTAGLATYLDLLDDLVMALFLHEGPTVAAIQGHAIAGGCVLALTCDHRVMTSSPTARIGLNEVALGLVFPPRVVALAKARIGTASIRRVLLEAGLYAPAEALGLGLVDELADDAVAVGRERLAKLASHPRHAYVATKRALTVGALDLSPEEVRHHREVVLPQWTSPELRMALAERLLKR